MATIDGLTPAQCFPLALGVKVGDIILIERLPVAAEDSTSDDSDEDARDWENGEESDGDESMEENGEDGREGEGDGGDSMGAVGTSHQAVEASGGGKEADADVAEGRGEQREELHSGTADMEVEVDGNGDSAEEDGEAEVEEDGEQGEYDDDGEAGDDVDVEPENEQAYPCEEGPTYSVYAVTQIIRNGPDTKITDLHLLPLSYENKPGDLVGGATFTIYGADTIHTSSTSLDPTYSLLSVLAALHGPTLNLYPNPSTDILKRHLFHSRCPAHCHQGHLTTPDQLQTLLTTALPPTDPAQPWRTLCPSCMGLTLTLDHFHLHMTFLGDFAEAFDLTERINARRRTLGYRFLQFDEREWGFRFDDMGDDDNGDGGDWGVGNGDANARAAFQPWAEADDANPPAVTRPASEETIAALPTLKYGEVVGERRDVQCSVCLDFFSAEDDVTQLPCGHLYCASGCVAQWLREFDNCPACRAKVGDRTEDEDEDEDDEGPEFR